MTDLINRPQYLNQLIQNKDVDLVKIVTGIRRCGKSSLLDLFHKYLTENGIPDAHIIHMNMESLRYRDLTNYLFFYDYVSKRISPDGKTYLIFDELQAVEHWKKLLNRSGWILMWISTSQVPMPICCPQSFQRCCPADMWKSECFLCHSGNFLTFMNSHLMSVWRKNSKNTFSLAECLLLREYKFNETRSNQALEGIYSTVVLRDILQRNNRYQSGDPPEDYAVFVL